MEKLPKLESAVEISRQFLRSIRIDVDLNRDDALDGYICQGTARSLLEGMAQQILQSKQRAFTWTGPYGGGKSSLALILCALVSGNNRLRKRAKDILNLPTDSPVLHAFSSKADGWAVFPISGKRTSIKEELKSVLISHNAKFAKDKNIDICAALSRIAAESKNGLLLVIDELGKFLEASAMEDGDDINFFQDLAETASRSSGKFVLVGILHQPFEAYATRLGIQARDDWAKVQGRYIDIPLISGSDEIVELISRSIHVHSPLDLKRFRPIANTVAENIRIRRPATPHNLSESLFKCWPLHPVTTSLIGPISRRKFGQNERSIFGFLTSKEPLSFGEYLATQTLSWDSLYRPSNFWDYLRANMEPAILASPDGHKWSQAVDAVERTESKGASLHVDIVKTVALIEMFRSGASLAPDLSTITACLEGLSEKEIAASLQELIAWKILIERKHIGAYGIYAGSDFDVEGSIKQARSELIGTDSKSLVELSDLNPIIAKKLYHEKGTMHWFGRQIISVSQLEDRLLNFKSANGSIGTFFLCLPDMNIPVKALETNLRATSQKFPNLPVVLGCAPNALSVAEISLELSAAEKVFATRTELEGDSVARREIVSRISSLNQLLQDELSEAFQSANWYHGGSKTAQSEAKTLSSIASLIAGIIFRHAPRINNELLNRDELSTNIVKARRELMYRMISKAHESKLGYEGYPADAGLYHSVLHNPGFHRNRGRIGWAFGKPSDPEFEVFWSETEDLIKMADDFIALDDIYKFWQGSPFGLKRSVLPVFALAYFLANKAQLALYLDDIFTPEISEVTIDEILHDPRRLKFKYVSAGENKSSLAKAISDNVSIKILTQGSSAPLDVARGLVSFVFALPNWARRTNSVSKTAQEVRGMLLKANDPNKVLFADLPSLLETDTQEELVRKLKLVVDELSQCYPKKIQEINEVVLKAIHHDHSDFSELQRRAKSIKGISGEFELEAFTNRIEEFDGSIEKTEALISLAVSKPPNMWVDRDLDSAILKLSDCAVTFRMAEAVAPLRGRQTYRKYFNLVLGGGKGKDIIQAVEISDLDQAKVAEIVRVLRNNLSGVDVKLIYASLVELGLQISQSDSTGD